MTGADVAAVTAANAELYAAIEAGDVDRLAAIWDTTDDVVCVHPGWPSVSGRSRVLRSWAVIMANTAYLQFFSTEVEVAIDADAAVAIVTCEHGVLARSDEKDTGFGETARVVASNVFRRRPDGWRLWSHHASPVLAADDDQEGTTER
ncbi:MAG TPA: nuclear transport factor 2 family protein [Mycobacteriales bacterium]|nr:nuclear transport factor 2 family protein [Mycobacteriales bacterium]